MRALHGKIVAGVVAGLMAGAISAGPAPAADPDQPVQDETEPELPVSAKQAAPGAAVNPRFKRPKTDNPTRDGTRALGPRNIQAAWFSGAIVRYRHSPFGINELHPDTITVSLADRRVMRLTLPADSVFEDRSPRIADIDGDGRDEILVIRSYQKKGSALAVIAVSGDKLEIVAETPALGQPFQWLNPAGVADFDGDGKPDIAIVAKPHQSGELQFWTLRNGEFEQLGDVDDVTNHVQGSTEQGLSAIADFNGDGVADIAMASENRRNLRFFTLSGGKLRDLGSAPLQAPVAENFEVVIVDGLPAVKVGFAGGRKQVIAPCRAVDDWRMVKGQCP